MLMCSAGKSSQKGQNWGGGGYYKKTNTALSEGKPRPAIEAEGAFYFQISITVTMAEYKLEVSTGDITYAGTWDHIYVTLFGTEGQSERTELDNYGTDFTTGTTGTYTVKTSMSLGTLLLIKVEKDPFFVLPEDEWYCSKIIVMTPEGDAILFPCYRWVSRGELVELRGGRAIKVFEENHPVLIDHRKNQLTLKKSLYQWEITNERWPHISSFKHTSELPAELIFSMSKSMEIQYIKKIAGAELMFKGLAGSTEQWKSIEDMKQIFWSQKTTMSEYVKEHWKEDDFYGFQFLNGINPNVIKRCSELPPNFPVTEDMVKPFLKEGTSLKEEMTKGNIFLCDFKRMDGLPTKLSDGESVHVTAGFCLFYMNPENKLMPIAIQLQQQPSEQNPIFLPSDQETDWLLAKMFIKNADSMLHQSVYHLVNTHLLAEVFSVAALRSFPEIHPLYKLLIPHVRYTLQINTLARKSIFGPDGILSRSSLGHEGMTEVIGRSLSETTYSSLCLPDNITARGLESIPNFYYRDDGLKLWNIINRFVKAIVGYYYPSDSEVCKDSELQEWIREIFTHGFLGNKASGCPGCFHAVKEVIRFITMVIFTVTAQHAAVNSGQFDYHSWVPNGSILLQKPPPTTKGQSSMKTILETLPNVGETASLATAFWILSEKYTDMVPLGTYPEERFDEAPPKQMIKEFQKELSNLSEAITTRNSQLKVPYIYLNPAEIENSITI
ncbi:polyunsaturated fatty acid lipoxygenase ALOX15B-like isoform X1 [Thunnus maccoyii]|uniref:polyunsaturated fatty acid lipoxygenase ALOX15B-like isoform X1 n=2 Tax=Thunnus maccoyii TaxID=8240 RepID=UPI001C4CB104|nr:polyunsaturated fatty acid lipoxygenase ALOX15B-like isoform X1 [Thunnus maccoyii]